MTVVTDIRRTKKGRNALFSDNGFLFSVDDETLAKNRVEIGSRWDDARLTDLRFASEWQKAKDQAMRFLARRAHCARELEQKLRRDYDEQTAADVVVHLCDLGLVCDAAYAEERAQQLAARGKSPADIQNRLMAAGVSGDLAARTVSGLDLDGVAAAYAVLAKQYLGALRDGEEQKVKAALARRGFKHDEITGAVRRVREELL